MKIIFYIIAVAGEVAGRAVRWRRGGGKKRQGCGVLVNLNTECYDSTRKAPPYVVRGGLRVIHRHSVGNRRNPTATPAGGRWGRVSLGEWLVGSTRGCLDG